MEYDKIQSFSLTSCTPVVTATDPDTGVSTVHVTTSAIGPGVSAELDSARLQVFDPEGSPVASADASGYLPADGSTLDFPDVSITFDKAGDYVFMVSADAKVCNGTANIDKAHRIMPINPTGTKIVAVKPATIAGPEGPLCPGESGTYTATTEPAGHESMLRWSGGDDPATAEGPEYTTRWYTSGAKTVKVECAGSGGPMPVVNSALTKQVTVEDPDRQVTFLEPSGTIGGKVAVRMSVSTKCATSDAPVLEEKEETTLHETSWQPLGPGDLESQVTEDGITTSVFKWIWNTTPVHNGTHRLHATTTFNTAPGHTEQVETEQGVSVLNLAITSANPEGVVTWKGEGNDPVPVTINVEDNDTSDPMAFHIAFYSTAQNNRGGWTPTRVMDAYGITGGSYTFNWDGLDDNETPAAPGTYTYEVEIEQTDVNPPDLSVDDSCTYRSPLLHIIRAVDDGNAPIFDVEYDGYDDNGTPDDETDDNYMYIIRHYVLQDDEGVDASQGELQLYDPSLSKVRTWNVAGLECVIDSGNDGLHATGSGVHHALKVPVPVGQFSDEGIYKFVLHLKDDHAPDYRDHRLRWALELNSAKAAKAFYTEDDWMVTPSGQSLRVAVRHPKYKQAFAEGNWTAKYAADNFCTQVPYQRLMQEDDYSGYSYEWFDKWGSRNGDGNPHRFVHVVGAAYPSSDDYRADEKWGYSDVGRCTFLVHTAARWSFVFVEKFRYWYEEYGHGDCDSEILLCAIHEVGHSAFDLPDHDTPEYTKTPCPVAAPPHLMECVMCQGEPDSRTRDFRLCSKCLRKIKAYGDCGW